MTEGGDISSLLSVQTGPHFKCVDVNGSNFKYQMRKFLVTEVKAAVTVYMWTLVSTSSVGL